MQLFNIDKEAIQWIAVGVCVLLVAVGIYAGGVQEGGRAMREQMERERSKLVVELEDTKARLTQARADLVGAKAQAAADNAINCEAVCAQEVATALKARNELVCGEFK